MAGNSVAGIRLHVDYRTSVSLLGSVLTYLSTATLLPLGVALYYREDPLPFLVTGAVMLGAGLALERAHPEPRLRHREAFLLVSITWLVVPVVGTLPYLVAGQGAVAHPVDALFESMSGFTTTGSTVLEDISFETHSHAILLWRQLTQWLGGMGILVLMVAILPELSVGGAQVVGEEAPGPTVEKLRPHIQDTARALWSIYVGLTAAAAIAFYALHFLGVADNMTAYNAVAHALTTLPTGGFSPEARSVEAFSPAVQWVVILFMVVAGTNFALFWYALEGRPRRLVENVEFRSYLLAMGVVSALVAVLLYTGAGLSEAPPNVGPLVGDVENSLRQAVFQVASIVTTTGYASTDFNTWDESTQVVLLLAMFLGGSAGSAAGSIKIVRWYVVRRAMGRELFTTVHPEAVRPIQLGRRIADDDTVRSILVFVITFLSLFAVSTVLVYLDALRVGLDLTALEATSATIATLGNVGPGVGIVGPMENFGRFSDATKLYMVFLMWIGRLEILSVLVILTPTYWRR